jgi:hypothetical protein
VIKESIMVDLLQRRIQDFKLGGGALKKIAPSGGRREHFWGISCKKSRFYAKKSFYPILGGCAPGAPPTPGSSSGLIDSLVFNRNKAVFQ